MVTPPRRTPAIGMPALDHEWERSGRRAVSAITAVGEGALRSRSC